MFIELYQLIVSVLTLIVTIAIAVWRIVVYLLKEIKVVKDSGVKEIKDVRDSINNHLGEVVKEVKEVCKRVERIDQKTIDQDQRIKRLEYRDNRKK